MLVAVEELGPNCLKVAVQEQRETGGERILRFTLVLHLFRAEHDRPLRAGSRELLAEPESGDVRTSHRRLNQQGDGQAVSVGESSAFLQEPNSLQRLLGFAHESETEC